MKSFCLSSYTCYLERLAEFIHNKFCRQNLRRQVRIILPNDFACRELKEILTSRYKIESLPVITPFSAIISDNKENNLNVISSLEEQLLLSEIITDYKELSFNLNEALKAAQLLSKLFNELLSNNADIKLIATYNDSRYWQKIYRFLEHSFLAWQKKIAELGKISSASHKLSLLQQEITKIKNNTQKVVVAGLYKNEHLIEVLRNHCANNDISVDCRIGSLNDITENISYIEPQNIYHEAEQIASICKQYIGSKIAIITSDLKVKHIYCSYLLKESLIFQDMLGNDLSLTNASGLIISISQILCNDFDLKLLFLLLKNPLVSSNAVQALETILSNKNRFVNSPEYLLKIIQNSNEELINYVQELTDILYTNKVGNILPKNILETAIEIAEKLVPNIWQDEEKLEGRTEFVEFLNNLTNYIQHITLTDKKDFPKILSSLISNLRYYGKADSARILIGAPENLALSAFDLVILPGFNNQNWPPVTPIHPWLSNEARQLLNINYEEKHSALYSDYFHLLLHNKQVIILNPQQYEGKTVATSTLFLKLQLESQNILSPSLKGAERGKKTQQNKELPKLPTQLYESSGNNDNVIAKGAYSTFFPGILSVTDIETLIKCPYSFYAKKILGLHKKDKIWEEPKISDFGSFIHKVLEKYSKNYEQNPKLVDIGNQVLHHMILPIYTKKTWEIKLRSLAEAFILFDTKRRKNCNNIYFEIKGELKLSILGQDIKIVGIADRIEVSRLNQVTILDYKTGTIPTKKEIESALSPQLIIEALMILENGFKIGTNIDSTIHIIYVKISSQEPYIQTTEISLTYDELQKHKKGLINFLEYYISNKFFAYDLDLLTYNDYLHLRR